MVSILAVEQTIKAYLHFYGLAASSTEWALRRWRVGTGRKKEYRIYREAGNGWTLREREREKEQREGAENGLRRL